METLGDLLSRDRRTDETAVRAPGAGDAVATYTYDDFVTTAWKTANFFSHRGVHREATVGIADDAAVPPLLAFFGAVQLGAAARFDPPTDAAVDLLVAPAAALADYDVAPGTTRMAYHGDPEDPAVAEFGRSVWSENPVRPPESVDPASAALATAAGTHSHESLLERTAEAAASLSAGDEVAIRAPLTDSGTVVAGVLAPLSVGATVVFPSGGEVCDVGVGEAVPESRRLAPE